ncbi:MAG TPA: hypothetical protein VGQ83_29910 [Polyangia bacterium]
MNCWEFMQCGREAGGGRVLELGVCPAYPYNGHSCAGVAGTLCGGNIDGSIGQKHAGCRACGFFASEHYGVAGITRDAAAPPRPGTGAWPRRCRPGWWG